jgi:hypothetical protein
VKRVSALAYVTVPLLLKGLGLDYFFGITTLRKFFDEKSRVLTLMLPLIGCNPTQPISLAKTALFLGAKGMGRFLLGGAIATTA